MIATRILTGLLGGLSLIVLAGCDIDPDLRGRAGGFSTADAARQATAERPPADSRGVISYASYQVAVARRGDTVASVAGRVGLAADELANYNGLKPADSLRDGEVLALPRRVEGGTPTAGSGTGAPGEIDVASLASGAIDRAAGPGTAATPAPAQPFAQDPIRHQVQRGETAYSISRLYNVSLRALAEWNGLGPDFTVREGQYLMIPVAAEGTPAPGPATVTAPGVGSPAPEPPSAAAPLPDEQTVPVAAATPKPPSPDLAADKSARARLQMPVSGSIFREYAKGKNEGIDISASAGAPVVAAEAGTVATITQNTENVQIVVVRHAGNLLTVYAGLDQLKVKKGDSVSRGQQLGAVRAGNPPFLHFEVREGLESTDPVAWLR